MLCMTCAGAQDQDKTGDWNLTEAVERYQQGRPRKKKRGAARESP